MVGYLQKVLSLRGEIMEYESKFESLVRAIITALPEKVLMSKSQLAEIITPIIKKCIQSWDLVSRQEFDAQAKVLARTEEKLDNIAKQLLNLEDKPK